MIIRPSRVAVVLLLLLAGCQSGGVGDQSDASVAIRPHTPVSAASPLATARPTPITLAVRERPLGTGALPGRIGERKTLRNISMGFVTIDPPPAQLVADALTAELRAGGHSVVGNAPTRLEAEVQNFTLRTDVTALYWDVVVDAAIAVKLTAAAPGHNAATTYSATCTERTYVWPTNALVADAVGTCVADLARKFRDDPAMVRALGGG